MLLSTLDALPAPLASAIEAMLARLPAHDRVAARSRINAQLTTVLQDPPFARVPVTDMGQRATIAAAVIEGIHG